ncbi:MAG: asparaginase domain-containing protein [Patescibacteria group bacterium]
MPVEKETLNNPIPTIEVVYAGGTISSFATTEGYREGGHVVDLVGEISQRVPYFEERFSIGHKEVAFTGLSENVEPKDWDVIEEKVIEALERDPRGVIVTFGTDGMEQLARRLDNEKVREILTRKKAKLILLGANDDISLPETDAWDNLEFGFESIESDVLAGVYVAFHRKLIPAEKVVKKPFDYENDVAMTYIANDHPEYTLALQKQKERDDRIIAEMEAAFDKEQGTEDILEYAVNIVRTNHDEFLEYIASHDVRAVLLTLYHSGTANTENPSMSVSELVNRLRHEKGITFFAATENGEPVSLHAYETSIKLREAGVVPLYDMPRTVALAKLKLIDGQVEGSQLIHEMLSDKVGEIDESRVIKADIDNLVGLYT